jgi:hypothetical protein
MPGMILHAGANSATIEQVENVVTPENTDTHVRIPHVALVRLVTETLEQKGLRVVEQEFGLWGKNGERFFGLMTLANHSPIEAPDHALTLGLRNAHDGRFPAAGSIGSRVFVCDNLAFSGEVTFAGKHSKHIVSRLPGLVNGAVEKLIGLRGWQENRINAYKGFDMLAAAANEREMERNVHDLIIRMLDENVIPNQKVQAVVNEWRQPADPKHREAFAPRTVWSLFNAVTQCLKGTPNLLPQRTVRLHSLCDTIVGFAKITDTNVGDAVDGPDFDVETN